MKTSRENGEAPIKGKPPHIESATTNSYTPPGYEDLTAKLTSLAENLRGLQELGVAQYTPVVENIIATRCRDARHIEHTLDHLLDFACHPDGLVLYKSLCRYYYTIDPAATADYVGYYREMWEEETVEEEIKA